MPLPAEAHNSAKTERAKPAPEKRTNPFSAQYSGYGHIVDGTFQSVYPPDSDMGNFHRQANDYIQNFIRSPKFPCIFGQAAIKTDQCSISAYDDITNPVVAEGILHDIVRFQEEFEVPDQTMGKRGMFRSTIVAFKNPPITDDLQATEVLYTLLRNMHEINSEHYDWTEGFSNDIESPDFGFSAGRSAHFIAYFHPHADVPARVSDVQFIVFNSHHVVNAFKETKGMEAHGRAKALIRSRQVQPIHPYLGNHGDVNEWLQYALLPPTEEMEAAERDIRRRVLGECPFPHKQKVEDATVVFKETQQTHEE